MPDLLSTVTSAALNSKKLPLVFHPHYSIPFPAGHRFPMHKFRLLAETLRKQGILTAENEHQPSPLSLSILMQAHDKGYVQRFIRGELTAQEIKDIGLPWSEWLVERTLRAVSGTILTSELALQHGLACHLAGGTHHAHPAHGAGFCIFNDLAVAALALVNSGKAKKVLILDCDVHQGDGTVAFFQDRTDIIPISWHCEENYPSVKQTKGINIAIPKGAEDEFYLSILQRTLPALLAEHRPDFVFYDAGADVHKDDRLGYVNLTDNGVLARDHYMISQCVEQGIPVACVIGGGYDRQEESVAWRHSLLHQAANQVWQETGLSSS
ncbi:histone deacetylase family protein [Marinomonas pollencensis]|uniref:Acetoin utilization deacetylase AcuC-like enzyme n=1 Tax=Marinomonas pollencensis TaxID=491954 RepID=A0A3E0DPR3_9GAMM|nr:histone deacetylase [Marinomonas pollencensis]REG84242.1 acetoin utilization deacetylase AcuC-like enzyme [Marinomonas pollencensis]